MSEDHHSTRLQAELARPRGVSAGEKRLAAAIDGIDLKPASEEAAGRNRRKMHLLPPRDPSPSQER
jgi:hypothetical protein